MGARMGGVIGVVAAPAGHVSCVLHPLLHMRALPLLAALLVLAACDSSGDSSPDGSFPAALVGTWSLTSTESEEIATSGVAQSYADFNGPATGQITIAGDEAGELRYVASINARPDNPSRQAYLLSYDPLSPLPPSTTRFGLNLYWDGNYGYAGADLTVSSSLRVVTYRTDTQLTAAPFSIVDGRLHVDPVTLTTPFDAGRQVQVSGEMAFPIRMLAAGERTRVRQATEPSDGGFRYTLGAAGSYRAERDTSPNTTESVTGTWAVDGNLLLLSVMRGEITETQTFAYSVTEGQLRLTYPDSSCRGDESCLYNAAATLGLTPGTLTAYDYVRTLVFTSGTMMKATPGTISPVDERAIWPRMLARPATRPAS